MWVPQYKAHLGLRCEKCNAELEGELSESKGYNETTIIVVVECECTKEMDQKIFDLEQTIQDLENEEEENNAEADS